ncbi:MAG: D-lactate ferricytochrome c oxidoreductase [Watsoniomyces obsoletus]|nr:MAG: D-lactate ferricytochrome c oxidoreductase [Watsoniomyces obsoletus]
MADIKAPKTSSMDSSYPVLVPVDEGISLSNGAYKEYLDKLLLPRPQDEKKPDASDVTMTDVKPTAVADDAKSSAPTESTMVDAPMESTSTKTGQSFIDALRSYDAEVTKDPEEELRAQNKMLTNKGGVTNASTNDPRLDLFVDMEKTITGERLQKLLKASWDQDPLDTLKIIWNARSIHLGKGERDNFYRCIGWLRQEGHLKTIVENLPWAVRPIIEKKAPTEDDEKKKKDEEDEVAVMVEKTHLDDDDDMLVDVKPEEKKKKTDITEFDLPTGVAHGYWKDLLNLLVLEVNGQLNVLTDPQTILKSGRSENKADEDEAGEEEPNKRRRSTGKPKGKRTRFSSSKKETPAKKEKPDPATREARLQAATEKDREHQQAAREKRHEMAAERHRRFLERFEQNQPDGFYRALHLTVARLFADQLHRDLRLLKSNKKGNLKRISLAAKWAPSLERLHDKHTFIASTIAELLYPSSAVGQEGDSRETYLKRAREHYRSKCLSPLRKALAVVERDVSAETFSKIDYQTVPSLAMRRYKDLFLEKDADHFMEYIDAVAAGEQRISGAVLQPAVLVGAAMKGSPQWRNQSGGKKRKIQDIVAERKAEMNAKVADGQWNSLVQRMRDSGKLESSIAVCDVSGSMFGPTFADGTNPLCSSIGLSLLLAEITDPPFGGNFITFSEEPQLVAVGGLKDYRTFTEKIQAMQSSKWGMTTNFVSVFEDLILPMAIKNRIEPEDMVKQIFVFSDMHFDSVQPRSWIYESEPSSDRRKPKHKDDLRFETHYERLQKEFQRAGYEMPKMVFWNLAGGARDDDSFAAWHQKNAPKPVTKDVPGTALVSGYSQGQMKMFLSGGLFGDDEEKKEEAEAEKENDDDDEMVVLETEMKDGKEEVVEKIEKKKKENENEGMTPLKTLLKAIGHKAYSMLKVVD